MSKFHSLRNYLRRWLGIVGATAPAPQCIVCREEYRLTAAISRLGSVTSEIVLLQQKFDLLADALGVVIVADVSRSPPEVAIEAVKDGPWEDHQSFIRYVVAADKIVTSHRRMVENVQEIMKSIDWRNRNKEKR